MIMYDDAAKLTRVALVDKKSKAEKVVVLDDAGKEVKAAKEKEVK